MGLNETVYGNQQCSKIIEEFLQQLVEVAAATVRGTPRAFLRIRANMLRRVDACIACQEQYFQHLL